MSNRKKVVALGFFDGVHVGHQALLSKMTDVSEGGLRCVYTFENHPASFFKPCEKHEYICLPEEKIELLKKYGAQEILSPRFNEKIASVTADDFARFLFEHLGTKAVVVGKNYRFGKGAQGDSQLLAAFAEKRGASVHVVDTVELFGEAVSSTRIRMAVKNGDVEAAGEMLRRPFAISGKVVEGKKLGRTLNIPTANITAPENRVIPLDGVYEGRVTVEGESYRAVVNVGANPTVDGKMRTIESHILDFSQNIYGEEITISFISRIRGEVKFASVEELKEQILRDIASVK